MYSFQLVHLKALIRQLEEIRMELDIMSFLILSFFIWCLWRVNKIPSHPDKGITGTDTEEATQTTSRSKDP